MRIIISVFSTAGVTAQEEQAASTAQPAEAFIRGDMVPQTPKVPGREEENDSHLSNKKIKEDFVISDEF